MTKNTKRKVYKFSSSPLEAKSLFSIDFMYKLDQHNEINTTNFGSCISVSSFLTLKTTLYLPLVEKLKTEKFRLRQNQSSQFSTSLELCIRSRKFENGIFHFTRLYFYFFTRKNMNFKIHIIWRTINNHNLKK